MGRDPTHEMSRYPLDRSELAQINGGRNHLILFFQRDDRTSPISKRHLVFFRGPDSLLYFVHPSRATTTFYGAGSETLGYRLLDCRTYALGGEGVQEATFHFSQDPLPDVRVGWDAESFRMDFFPTAHFSPGRVPVWLQGRLQKMLPFFPQDLRWEQMAADQVKLHPLV